MIEKKTIVDQVMVDRCGIVHVRLKKQVLEEGVVLAFQYHRTVLEPGRDSAAHLDLVNAHLWEMDCAEVLSSEWQSRVDPIVRAAWTADVLEAWSQMKSAAEAELAGMTANRKAN